MFGLRDWVCSNCGYIIEDVTTDIQEQECPDCKSSMSKVYSPLTVIFNGDGWTPKYHQGVTTNGKKYRTED